MRNGDTSFAAVAGGESVVGGESGARNLRGTGACGPERRFTPPAPSRSMDAYQSNFAPKRQSLGGMIVVGCRKFEAEPQLMFWAALEFVRL